VNEMNEMNGMNGMNGGTGMTGRDGTDQVIARKKRYVFPNVATFYAGPLVLERGEGRTVWDSEGRSYLDFFVGILTTSIGHAHPHFVKSMTAQVGKLVHTSTLYINRPMVDMAERLAALCPDGDWKTFFTNSGTEANETAILLSRVHTGHTEVIALRHSYHGRSGLAMALTGNATWRHVGTEFAGIRHTHNAYCFRCPFRATYPECDLACPEGAHNPTDACGRVHTCECVPEDCSDVPQCEFECPADTHNPVDARGCTHTCECAPDSGDCTDEECGPAPMCPAYECDDGSLGGCTGRCYRLTDDSCGWEIRNCPSDALRWYWTCGDPVCGGPGGHRESGLPECTTEEAGEPCTSEGASCDPMDDCNAHLICARSDPRQEPGGCPISRREFKRDIHYLTPEDRARFSDEIMDMRLATYRYRDAPDRLRLGFIIEDQEPSVSIDAGRDMVDLYGYVSMAVATLQRQSEEIAALRLKLEELNARCAPGEAAVCQ